MAPPSPLSALTDQELKDLVKEHGSQRKAAIALGVHESSIQKMMQRRGLAPGAAVRVQSPSPATARLDLNRLHEALLPPNGCRVKAFRESLDADSQAVLDEALSYERYDLPASKLRVFLLSSGFPERDVPGVAAINAHRAGARPCRCKG